MENKPFIVDLPIKNQTRRVLTVHPCQANPLENGRFPSFFVCFLYVYQRVPTNRHSPRLAHEVPCRRLHHQGRQLGAIVNVVAEPPLRAQGLPCPAGAESCGYGDDGWIWIC